MRLKSLFLATLLSVVAMACHAGAKEDIQADMRAGRWTEADSKLSEVLSKHPDNALAHYWRAEVKFKLGEIAQAQDEARRAQAIDPSEKFASNKATLQRILQAKPVAAPHPEPATTLQQEVSPRPVAEPPPAPMPQPEKSSGIWLPFVLVAVVVAVLAWRFTRSAGRQQLDAERKRWAGALDEASRDLADALAASDANPQHSPEVKLGNYDRVRKAQADVAGHKSALASADDFSTTRDLVARSHDIAADIRGEERPSERAARLQAEQQALQAQRAAGQAGPVYVQQTGPGGSGMLGTAAAVGAGLVIGELLSGHAEARPHRNTDTYVPIDDDDGGQLDLGGADTGSNNWDTGGVDVGGDGGSGDFS